MTKESIVEIPTGSGNKYRYVYENGETKYRGPVGSAPELSEQEFLKITNVSVVLTNEKKTLQEQLKKARHKMIEKMERVRRVGKALAEDIDEAIDENEERYQNVSISIAFRTFNNNGLAAYEEYSREWIRVNRLQGQIELIEKLEKLEKS